MIKKKFLVKVFQTSHWWDEKGPFAILHRLTPLRMSWILGSFPHGLAGKKVLDLGCGGGLLSEPLARLGAEVLGVDECHEALDCARNHQGDLPIRYCHGDAHSWVPEKGVFFDLILLMEMLEHTPHPFDILLRCSSWLSPLGGMIVGSTLNRTWLSYILGIVVAERITRWVPKGTHLWSFFLQPEEITAMMQAACLESSSFQGFSLGKRGWDFSSCQRINYFFSAVKPPCLLLS